MGVSPILGRDFTTQEEHWDGPDAVLISYRFWQRRFNRDPEAVGKKLRVGSFHYSIVGIMPVSFAFPNRDVDMWAPSPPDAPYALRRDATWFTVIGRMKQGVGLKQAAADLATVQSQLGKQFPKPDAGLNVETEPLKDVIVGSVRNSLWLLYGSVTLLLLIACSNIAALLLARTADREHDISIRFSLGASRANVVAQLLTEVFVLALIGSLAGLALSAFATQAFHRLANTLPRAEEIALNWRVALYSLAAALATTLLCGALPAMRGTRRGLARSLALGSRTQASTRNPLQSALVAVQVTLAVTLLVGAGLLMRSIQEVGRVYPGFDPSNVLTFQVSGSWGETTNMNGVVQRIGRTLDGLRSLPGVEAASTAAMLPGIHSLYQLEFKIDARVDPGHKILADSRFVSAGYLDSMKIPLLAGQDCPRASNTTDVLVNRTFANLYLNNAAMMGRHLGAVAYNDFQPDGQIRGIVADAREEGLNNQPIPTVYTCFNAPNPFPNYLVRTNGDPMQMADAVRRRIHELEPGRSVYAMMPLQEHLNDASAENRLRTILLAMFAATAVSLACIGLYGTLSYLGRLRQREIGVRLALGAMRRQIVMHFLFQGLRLALIGCIAGLALGRGLSRFLAGMLYGVSPLDLVTYSSVVLLILVVAALASLAPAVRAAWVEPTRILRED